MIESLEGAFEGRDLVILGNSPLVGRVDLAAIKAGAASPIVMGLNAAPAITSKVGLELDYHVMFDYRFLDLKGHLVLGHLDPSTVCLWGEHVVGGGLAVPGHRVLGIPFLGYEGFSRHLPAGAFAGHTVAHPALQIAYFARPRRVYLLGVDLTYGARQPRFYQTERGDDVELHVRGRQLHWLARGAGVLAMAGIPTAVVGDESYLRGYVPSVSFDRMVQMLDTSV